MVEIPYRLIIAATDGSAAATEAIRRAIDLARVYNARLRIVHVVNTRVLVYLEAYQHLVLENLREHGERAVEEAVQMAEDAGVHDVEGVVLSGNPGQEIVNFAKEQQADLIVVGSHGYSYFSALMIGSVAEYVVHNVLCDVLLVESGDRS
jgi:nucleotide-binding universal stress UspA family protein